jgi:hypothetical protein
VQGKTESNEQVQLQFVPDYEDDRNKEWAKYTPGLSFSMTVLPEIGEKFEVGEKITFYAEPTQSDENEGGGTEGGGGE